MDQIKPNQTEWRVTSRLGEAVIIVVDDTPKPLFKWFLYQSTMAVQGFKCGSHLLKTIKA